LDGLTFALMLGAVGTAAFMLLPTSIIMSSLFDTSAKFTRHALPITNLISDKKMRKQIEGQLKACSLIRCQVGSFYHMEAKAKLTLIQQMVQGVVFLLYF
jgi:hypothetical protein